MADSSVGCMETVVSGLVACGMSSGRILLVDPRSGLKVLRILAPATAIYDNFVGWMLCTALYATSSYVVFYPADEAPCKEPYQR